MLIKYLIDNKILNENIIITIPRMIVGNIIINNINDLNYTIKSNWILKKKINGCLLFYIYCIKSNNLK